MALLVMIILTVVLPLFAFILHGFVLSTICKYRYKYPFNTPFFHLLFSLHFSDIIVCLFHFVNSLFYLLIDSYGKSIFAGTADGFVITFGVISNQTALVFIAVNRLINMLSPFEVNRLWPSRMTKISIAIQWSMGLLFGLPFAFHVDFQHMYNDQKIPLPLNGNSTLLMVHGVIWSVHGVVCSVVMAVLYTIIVVRMVHHNSQVEQDQGEQARANNRQTEVKLALQGSILSSFVLFQGVLNVLWYLGIEYPMWLLLLSIIVMNGNFYNGSPIAIAMSSELRIHMKKMVGIKEKTVVTTVKRKQGTTKKETTL